MTRKELAAYNERMLLSLANDIVTLNRAHESVVTKIRTMAVANRIKVPEPRALDAD